MDGEIYDVIADDAHTISGVVYGKRQVCDKAGRGVVEDRLKIVQMPYGRILEDRCFVIKMKGALEGIGVRKNANSANEETGQPSGDRPMPTKITYVMLLVLHSMFLVHLLLGGAVNHSHPLLEST